MLRKTFKEPGAGPLPHLRKRVNAQSKYLVLLFFRGPNHSPLAVLCKSCRATQHVADCYTASHTWCTCSAQEGKIKGYEELIVHKRLFFSFFINFSRQMCPTHLFAVLTHHWVDPRWSQLLPTQQTARHPIPAHSLLHVIQAVYQAPAAAQGETSL